MTPQRFTPRQLAAFIAAAELASFTLAAGKLNLTPSAVSNLIGELEAAVGFVLFDRTTRKIALTAAGRQFLPAALAVQRQMNLAAIVAGDICNRAVDVVRVAAPLSVAATILPPIIAAYRERESRTEVRIIDTGVEWLIDRLLSGEVDLAMGPDRAVSGDVVCARLYASAWVLWCSPRHPLAERGYVRWSDLEGIEFFIAGHDHEQSVAPLATRDPHNGENVPRQVFANVTTALGMVAANLGITFSPAYVGSLARPLGLKMCRIIEPEIQRFMTLYSPSSRELPAAVSKFRDFVIETVHESKSL